MPKEKEDEIRKDRYTWGEGEVEFIPPEENKDDDNEDDNQRH